MQAFISSTYDAFKQLVIEPFLFPPPASTKQKSDGRDGGRQQQQQGNQLLPEILKDNTGRIKDRALPSFAELLSVVRSYPEVYLFIGSGARAQYADVDEVISGLHPYLREIEQRCGGRRWLGIYGGDKARADAPDLGLLMKRLQEEYGCDLLAVQAGGGEPDGHTNFHFTPEQQFKYDEQSREKRVLYGGVLEGELVGGSRVYLANELIKPAADGNGRRLLTGLFVAGGGQVANEELQYADAAGLTWTYLPCRARFQAAYGTVYGPVHDWVKDRLAESKRPVVVTVKGE